MAKKISYLSRDFNSCRSDLVNFIRQYYPEIMNDFNDSSVGMMLLEIQSAISDMLSYNTDRMFQETQIDYAQQSRSLMSLARTYGLKLPNLRPSVTVCDFTITVPPQPGNGDTYMGDLCPIIQRGAQVSGGGKVFETLDDIDFTSPFTTGGIPNRLVLPNIDSNGIIQSYNIVKRELVINGYTKIYQKVLNVSDIQPFMQIILPDTNVLSVESIVILQGTNITTTPSINTFFSTPDQPYRWFEMDALADNMLFVKDNSRVAVNGIQPGRYLTTDNRFITEFTDMGFCRIIFGAGNTDTSSLCNFNLSGQFISSIGDIINNLSLGAIPQPNQTMFVNYRVGGGADTNIGANTINSVGIFNMVFNSQYGTPQQIQSVQQSLTVNNPAPALGGKDQLSVEEVRNLIRYNFSAQNRAVTLKDYFSIISTMPGDYGVPFRCGVTEEQNRIEIYVLSLDESGKVTSNVTSVLLDNISEYLSNYRMINDYVEINTGEVYDLSFQVDLFVDKTIPSSQIVTAAIAAISNELDVNKQQMGDNIYLGAIVQVLHDVSGIVNVLDLRVYNLVGGQNSTSQVPMSYLDSATRQIDTTQYNTLWGSADSIYQIRNPQKDISVRIITAN